MRRRRLTRREKRSRRKKAIIISSLCLLFIMTAGYAAFQTNLSITAKGNIKEPSRVMRSWTDTSQEDFHSDYYKENIVSATFLDTNQVPNNATESWDVSEDGKGGVKAWVVPNEEDSTKYDLYIGADGGVIANEDSRYLFYDMYALKTIDFNNSFDTSNAVNMTYMFASVYDNATSTYRKGSLTNIYGLDNFDTSQVTSMRGMFRYTSELTELDLSSFNTSNVTDMWTMFELSGVKTLNLNNFVTNKVTNMGWMFSNCSNLTELNISNFNTSSVTNMNGMFAYTSSLSYLDLSHFDTSNVTTAQAMFLSTNVSTINLCNWNTSNITNMTYMFSGAKNLKSIYVGSGWTTTNANTTNMFSNSGVSSVTTGQC